MTATADILTAVRGRLAALYPSATDATDRATHLAETALPAFAVTVERQGTEQLAMGNLLLAEDRVRVSLWQTGGDGLRLDAAQAMASITEAVLGTPWRLGGLVDDLQEGEGDVALEDAERRVARTDVTFLAQYAVVV